MKGQYRKIVSGILWALIFMVVAIMPANANAPVHVRDTWDFDYIDTDSCGFPLAVHIDLATNFMVWSDKDGNWLVDKLTGVSRASFTYEGRIVRLLENEITTVTYVDSHDGILEIKIQCPGMEWKGSVPGHGAVVGSAGNQVWTETCQQDDQGEWQCNLKEILHWSGMDFGDPTVVCNYLLIRGVSRILRLEPPACRSPLASRRGAIFILNTQLVNLRKTSLTMQSSRGIIHDYLSN